MKDYSVLDSDIHYVPNSIQSSIASYTISSDDIYITVAGTIGRVGLIPSKFDGANLTENANKLSLYEGEKAYLMYVLDSPFVQQQIVDITTKVGQPKLAIIRIQNLLVPICPLQEQARIASRISELQSKINQYDLVFNEFTRLNKSIGLLLKNSIIQDAIQGKLVPQIESESTAEELLEEIRTEKKRLVKEGMLKKSAIANESRIFRGDDNKYYEQIGHKVFDISDVVPFDIPDSWQWVRLNHIGMSELGKTMDKGKDSGENLPYLCSINVYWDGVNLDKVKTAQFTPNEKEKYKLQFGDLLVCEGGDVGRCAIWQERVDMWFQNALHRITLFNDINAQYIKYILEFYKFTGTIDKLCKGVTIKHFTQTALYSLLFPLPPLSEQQRIIDKVKSLMTRF